MGNILTISRASDIFELCSMRLCSFLLLCSCTLFAQQQGGVSPTGSGLLGLSDTLRSAIVGGLIGGLLSLAGVVLAYVLSECARNRREKKELQNLLASFYSELENFHERYSATIKSELKKEETKPLYDMFAISHAVTLYDANAFKMGMVSDNDLRTMIVRTYHWRREIIDTLYLNNNYYDQFRNYVSVHEHDSASGVIEDFLFRFKNRLEVAFAEFEKNVVALLPELQKAIARLN